MTLASRYATISHLIAQNYNIACIKILHLLPLDFKRTERVFNWIKNPPGGIRKSIGVSTIQDELTISFEESTCFKPMNVVIVDENLQDAFSQLTLNEDTDRSLWLLFLNSSIEEFFEPIHVPFSTEMTAVQFTDDNHAQIFDVYRVDFNHPVRVNPLGSWSSKEGLFISDSSTYHRRSNLEGKALQVGLMENWPISYQVDKEGVKVWEGFFPEVWKEIEEAINVSSYYVRSVDRTTGSVLPNGSWSGLIGMAIRKEIDVIVSELTMNARRSLVLDFSRPLLKSRYQIYFKDPGYLLDWTAVFRPFPLSLWEAIIAWIFVISAGLSVCYSLSVRHGIEREHNTPRGYFACLFFALQSLSQQGQEDSPRSLSCRILFFSSYLLSSIVIPAYSASLISSLTQKTPDRPFNSIREMVEDGSYNLLVANNSAESDYFSDTNDEFLSLAYRRLIATVPADKSMKGIRQALNTVCREKKYAVFAIESIVSQRLLREPLPPCRIIAMTRPVSSVHLGMALIKHHHYQPIINYHLLKMIDTGALHRFEMATWRYLPQPAQEIWSDVHPEEVFQMFAFLGAAMVVACIICGFEILMHRRKLLIDQPISTFPYKN